MSKTVNVQVNQISPSTSEGTTREHRILMDRPTSKGGEDSGAMGGEVLLMGLGGCLMSNLLAAIRAREAEVSNIRMEITGTLGGQPERFTTIEVAITADYQDKALMEKLITIAERGCLVANTLKSAVELSLTVR